MFVKVKVDPGDGGATAPTFTSADSTSFKDGSAGSFTVTTTGEPTPVVSENGSLPAGLSFSNDGDGTGTLSGTPTQQGSFRFSFSATNGYGTGAFQQFALTVTPPLLNGVQSMVSSGNTYCALLMSGEVDCWGNGEYGGLGNGQLYSQSAIGSPPVPFKSKVSGASAFFRASRALSEAEVPIAPSSPRARSIAGAGVLTASSAADISTSPPPSSRLRAWVGPAFSRVWWG